MFYDLYCILGVSQPYVSRYLKGDFTVMSERSCRSIKKWYLAYRRNPEAIGNWHFVHSSVALKFVSNAVIWGFGCF